MSQQLTEEQKEALAAFNQRTGLGQFVQSGVGSKEKEDMTISKLLFGEFDPNDKG